MKSKEERVAVRATKIAEARARVEEKRLDRFARMIEGAEEELIARRIETFIPGARVETNPDGEIVIFTGIKKVDGKLTKNK